MFEYNVEKNEPWIRYENFYHLTLSHAKRTGIVGVIVKPPFFVGQKVECLDSLHGVREGEFLTITHLGFDRYDTYVKAKFKEIANIYFLDGYFK